MQAAPIDEEDCGSEGKPVNTGPQRQSVENARTLIELGISSCALTFENRTKRKRACEHACAQTSR